MSKEYNMSTKELNEFSKQDINKLILNYLIMEGYETTSLKFAKEMGIELEQDENSNNNHNIIQHKELIGINSIEFRRKVKLLILKGDIQTAIDELNLNYPELLETNQFLYFKLLLLNLIEMIKVHNKKLSEDPENIDIETKEDEDPNSFILKIIKFAQEKLTNKAIKNPKFMEELELAMTLLLFSNNQSDDQTELPKKLNRLLGFRLRRDTADLINKAILLNDPLSSSLSKSSIERKNIAINPDALEDNSIGYNIEDDEYVEEDLANCLIDSNLKKMIKFWIWSENQINIDELKKFEI